ncbi:hypothetical protein Ga0074812_108103 [Parafrankia irregularis]|uniref:Uncharacterized protein n=1 Tax=Parafrankia irregularis TaxID=795642 RepID=A0A0S4QNA6_9ACTN|nr:hypothetical protein Ga0074812_108103 [Parafrankia irregularis]
MGLPVECVLNAGTAKKILIGSTSLLVAVVGPDRLPWAPHRVACHQRIRLACCGRGSTPERRCGARLLAARGRLQGLQEFRSDVGPANE